MGGSLIKMRDGTLAHIRGTGVKPCSCCRLIA